MNESVEHIQRIVEETGGGVPSVFCVQAFDLSWSLSYLILMDIELPNLKKHFDKLLDIWNETGGHVPAALGLPGDADDTACALFALQKHCGSIITINTLMTYYHGDHFLTFKEEFLPSLSTNINCLIALKAFEEKQLIEKTSNWIKNRIIESEFQIQDKWHFSLFYPLSRALIAFTEIDSEFCLKIIDYMIYKIRDNSGWGFSDKATKIETALVVISLIYWLRNGQLYPSKLFDIIKESKRYFENSNHEEDILLWIDKGLYSPVKLDMFIIKLAEYSINCFLQDFNF